MQLSLYQVCSKTPMDVFIDCLVNQNLRRLLKYGWVTPSVLIATWEKLFSEYCELAGDPKLKSFVNLTKSIGSIQGKLIALQICLYVLNDRDSKDCAAILNKIGFPGNYKGEGKADELLKVTRRLKSFQFELKQKLNEYQALVKDGENSKIEPGYFDKEFVELSKFMGYRIAPGKTTVLEFVNIRNRYQKEIEVIKNTNYQ